MSLSEGVPDSTVNTLSSMVSVLFLNGHWSGVSTPTSPSTMYAYSTPDHAASLW